MNLQDRIDLLVKLRQYLTSNDGSWADAKLLAEQQNPWFTQPFIQAAVDNLVNHFLEPARLNAFVANYSIPPVQPEPKNIGLVMAGNIPLVGFHDWLCIFLSGHRAVIKPSSKDTTLIKHILHQLAVWNPAINDQTRFAEMLKGADAYIATGSNNTARYFDYYFSKYPHIIRRNRTSVAILTGDENMADLEKLADDVNLYFGLGCRNVTKIYVPRQYDFIPLLEAMKKYIAFADHNKYKNNYDYQLAILLLNNKYYMTNGAQLLVENEALFSAISSLHYEFYEGNPEAVISGLKTNPDVQCIVGRGEVSFGDAQSPRLNDFADGVDTLAFLLGI